MTSPASKSGIMQEVYIISAARTPLGSHAIRAATERAKIDPQEIQEVFMGNVLSANLGQAPARQASIGAGIGFEVPCTTINKVCASGMKAIMLAAQSIMTGQQDVMVAGGMESMSNVPYYIPKARFGYKYGHGELVDGLAKDGLHDVYYDFAMGNCAENTAREMGITRESQDEYAIQSYKRSAQAWENGSFKEEVVPIAIKDKKGSRIIHEDEEFKRVNFDKIPMLNSVFQKDGTVTAANSSTMNDGASALLLVSKNKAEALGLRPVAKIRGFADASQDPVWFTTTPALAIPKAIRHAGLSAADIDYYEINEAFAAVAIANQQKLGLSMDRLNVYGGAVALGHPLGCSGARIITTLNSVLSGKNGQYGVAAVCNGGGGASALVIEKI